MKKRLLLLIVTVLFTISTGQTTRDSSNISEKIQPLELDRQELKQNEAMMSARRKEIKLDETLSNIIQDLDTIDKSLR